MYAVPDAPSEVASAEIDVGTNTDEESILGQVMAPFTEEDEAPDDSSGIIKQLKRNSSSEIQMVANHVDYCLDSVPKSSIHHGLQCKVLRTKQNEGMWAW